MKNLILSFFLCLPLLMTAQHQDSLVVARQADSLVQIVRKHGVQRNFEKALEALATAENLVIDKFGQESAACGNIYYERGRLLQYKGDYTEAKKWFSESKLIREKTVGKSHPDYAWSLQSLGYSYQLTGDFKQAEELYLESRAVREKYFGKEHSDYAWSLNNLGVLYQLMGKYDLSESFLLEAQSVREKVLSKEHPDYTATLNNLAGLYLETGAYEKAETLITETLFLREKRLGKEHPEYLMALNNLSALYHTMGFYEKALQSSLEAKSIFEKVLGKEHPNYALILINLGHLYMTLSDYEKAELVLLEAKVASETAFGKESKHYLGCLANLGALYWWMSNYAYAERYYLEGKAIMEKLRKQDGADYALVLRNLGGLYHKIHDYEKARNLYEEAIRIYEKVFGKNDRNYAWCINNLAGLYWDMGNYNEAEKLYLEAKNIRKEALGVEHADYANSILNLAKLYSMMRNDEKAEPLHLEAQILLEKSLGKAHPFYVGNLSSLAALYERQLRFSNSEPLLHEIVSLQTNKLKKALSFLSEQELANYATTFQGKGDEVLNYLLARPIGYQGNLPLLGYDNSLFYKGFLLGAASRLNTLSNSTPEATKLHNRLKSYHRRLATEYAKPIAERKGVEGLEEKANAAEKELARTVAGYADDILQVKWQEVQATLKKGEAAVEFVHFRVNFPKNTDSTMYAALLLRPGASQPLFIPLFEEKQLDSLLQLKTLRRADYVSDLYSYVERSMVIPGRPKKSLGELLWKPLENHLLPAEGTKAGDGVKTIYYSPSGLLHRLNLAAVSISPDSVLADRFRLVELGSTRQLVVPAEIKPAANDAVLFGGIRYETDTTAIDQANAAPDSFPIASSRGELSFAYADSSLRVGTWNYLHHTEKEVTALDQTLRRSGFKIDACKGYAATEEAFKRIGQNGKPSPRVLHLATHGFFFPDPKTVDARRWTVDDGEPVFKISDHPMIRSGLILAGGNHAWKTGKSVREGLEDGILTAYEISQMNLSNTELVVLSACETGLGDISGNEGVYGLQRAFKIAGAKYLIVSLWQVRDKQTSLLMTTFYKKWLEDKMAIPEAFRAAQKELREAGLDPYQWAGFVLVE